jgi:hypothetical protein
MSKRGKEPPIILGGGELSKGIVVWKIPNQDAYELAIVWLKKEFPHGERFEIDDIEKVQTFLHFCTREAVEIMANALNHIMEDW